MNEKQKDKGLMKAVKEQPQFRLTSNFTFRTMQKVEEAILLRERKQERKMLLATIAASLFLIISGSIGLYIYFGNHIKETMYHALLGVHAACDGMAMAAVGGREVIFFLNGGKCACLSSLLADAQVDVASQHTLGEALSGMLFKLPDPYHGAVETQQLFLGVLFSSVLFRCQCFHAFLKLTIENYCK